MSKYPALILMVFALSACTNSEQAEETARQERREAEMRRLQEERQQAEQQKEQERAVEETPTEPEAPPEPEYEDKEYYKFDGTECEQYEVTACGVNFYRCANHMIYECFTNVKYTTTTKKVLVE